MKRRLAAFVAAGALAACLHASPVRADDPVEYVITYDPTILAGTDSSGTLTGIEGFGAIELGPESNCVTRRFFRRIVLVLLRDEETISVRTLESFSERPDDPLARQGRILFQQERPLARVDSPATDFDLSGNFFAPDEGGDMLGRFRMTLRDVAGQFPMMETNPGTFHFSSTSAWPMEAYWKIVDALRADETEISFPLGPFGMPGITPPLEDDDGLVSVRVIDWPPEAGSFAPPDDEIFAGRHWPVLIEVDHRIPHQHGPTHWVVELYESGAPGRFIYDFGYVQILMQPAAVTREPAQNC